MKPLHLINTGQCISQIELKGTGLDKGNVGLQINTLKTELTKIDRLIVTNTCEPVHFKSGQAYIRQFISDGNSGDTFKLLHDHGVIIDQLHIINPSDHLGYSDKYHVDLLGQAYSNKNRDIGNLTIKKIYLHTKSEKHQGFLASEGHNRYYNIHLGTESLYIDMPHPFWAQFTSIENGIFGNKKAVLTHHNGLYIGSKEHPIKKTEHTSQNIQILGDCNNKNCRLPPNIMDHQQQIYTAARALNMKPSDLEEVLAIA